MLEAETQRGYARVAVRSCPHPPHSAPRFAPNGSGLKGKPWLRGWTFNALPFVHAARLRGWTFNAPPFPVHTGPAS